MAKEGDVIAIPAGGAIKTRTNHLPQHHIRVKGQQKQVRVRAN
jgi:hypothetical protein